MGNKKKGKTLVLTSDNDEMIVKNARINTHFQDQKTDIAFMDTDERHMDILPAYLQNRMIEHFKS